MAKKKNLKAIFYPKSIAVVGANNVKGTVPFDIYENILKMGFKGPIYPVSPRDPKILGNKTYKYLVDVKGPVDLAVVVFPSTVCDLAMEQLAKKKVKAAIVISNGFKEVGEEGKKRQEQLLKMARKANISIIGPNCLGVLNTDKKSPMCASFACKMPVEGNIAFVTQSGGFFTAVLDYARGRHIGFSKFVSFGNKCDVNEADMMDYLADDPKTKVILLYLEEVADGSALLKAAKRAVKKGKAVLALKSGRSKEGAAAAVFHTGSDAGSDAKCDKLFKDAGIIRCQNIEHLFNVAMAISYQPLPKGPRFASITNTGGPAIMTTDVGADLGLKIPHLKPETIKALKKCRNIPANANLRNPVDIIGDAHSDRYVTALEHILKDDTVDGVFVILTPQRMTDIENVATAVVAASKKSKKPIYASFLGAVDVGPAIEILQKGRVPHYFPPESMAVSFAAAYKFAKMIGHAK